MELNENKETNDLDHDELFHDIVGAHACQLKQDDCNDINYERTFPIGSVFSFPVQATSSSLLEWKSKSDKKETDDKGEEESWSIGVNPATVHVSKGSKLSIRTVSIDPMPGPTPEGIPSASLYLSTDTNPDYLCLCPFLSPRQNSIITSLNIDICGPSVIQLTSFSHPPENSQNAKFDDENDEQHSKPSLITVNVFGSVSLLEPLHSEAVCEAKKKFPIFITDNHNEEALETNAKIESSTNVESSDVTNIENNTTHVEISKQNDTNNIGNDENRKRSYNKVDENTEKDEKNDAIPEIKKLTKNQRRKLAKRKAKELDAAIAKENGHVSQEGREQKGGEKKQQKTDANDNKPRKISLTRERSLKGGILVKDIIHGTGPAVRSGRKVSITYIGSFPESEKVFDKNVSKIKPLVFRTGTGQVIKGLDRGMEGMKVGGERIITVPPKMAYGSQGSPPTIPKNATLSFAVTLLSVGGK